MKKHDLKTLLWVLGVLFISTLVLLLILQGRSFTIRNIFKTIPLVVTIVFFCSTLFSFYLWKFRIFKGWLVKVPNLNGTYKGYIYSTWEDPKTNERPDPIPAIITINQSFLNISCVLRTEETKSESIISNFEIDKDKQIKRLLYTYESNPKQTVRDRSPKTLGSVVLDIIELPSLKLQGSYWTSNKTTGEMHFQYWKKEKLENYPKEIGDHPVSKIRDYKN